LNSWNGFDVMAAGEFPAPSWNPVVERIFCLIPTHHYSFSVELRIVFS